MVGKETQLHAPNSKSFLNEYLAKNKQWKKPFSDTILQASHSAHVYLLQGISEKKQKQQTVLALKEASRRELNFGQLIKQIQQILNKLFFHLILHTI